TTSDLRTLDARYLGHVTSRFTKSSSEAETVALALSFFFSSRRRHTRSLRDWSSDVCSSDLAIAPDDRLVRWIRHCPGAHYVQRRSEERRVGKECRSRGARGHGKRGD